MAGAGSVTRGAGGDAWSAWAPLDGLPATTPAVLAETLDGGQAFRWYRYVGDAVSPGHSDSPASPESATIWTGVWSDNVASVRLAARGTLEWSAPSAIATRVGAALRTYLGGAADFGACTDALPWRSDPHLAACMAAFPGLRILRQPFGETLLCFLCSATKLIVQIKQMVALLAERHGRPICRMAERYPHPVSRFNSRERGPSGVRSPHPQQEHSPDAVAPDQGPPSRAARGVRAPHLQPGAAEMIHALPSWEELARIPEAELRRCLLGFRAKYIAQTAQFLAAHAGWLEETESLPYPRAKERLCSLPGVGEKVADCVLLFGAGRLEAFPVDVWILRTMAQRYELHGWKPAQLAQFGRVHFGPYAGLAQQFLFAWERQRARRVST